jgi:protocatechuate 3,4-dioxygenase beta subunit
MRSARRTWIPRAAILAMWAATCLPAPTAAGPAVSATPETAAGRQTPAAAPAGAISGRVTSAGSGTPVARARVTVTSPALAEPRVALTDSDGQYRLADLPAGRFAITVVKTGFVTTTYGEATGTPLDVELAAGHQITGADVALPPAGVLAGRIRDEDGTPIAGVRVSAMRPRFQDGREALVAAGSAMTDDLGGFRIADLPPGLFFVAAADPAFDRVGDASGPLEYSPTYYPGTVFPDEAVRVKVDAGQVTPPVEFGLEIVRPARVSGRIVASDGRELLAGAVVMTSARSDRYAAMPITDVTIKPDGTFLFRNVPAGHYVIRARGETDRGGHSLFGRFMLDVQGRDVSNVRVTLSPGAQLSGRVDFEGRTPPTGDALATIRVQAVATDGVTFGNALSGPIQANGDFTFPAIMPGDHVLRVRGLPGGWSLLGVFSMGREVTDVPFSLDGGQRVSNIRVIVSDVSASISGRVTDADGRPRPDALVVVFPIDPSLWTRFSRHIRRARPDADGRYRVAGLPAGEYLILATDAVDEADVLGPRLLERLSPHAARLTVTVGARETRDLRVTPLRAQAVNGHAP